jgi:hypothetical protein
MYSFGARIEGRTPARAAKWTIVSNFRSRVMRSTPSPSRMSSEWTGTCAAKPAMFARLIAGS